MKLFNYYSLDECSNRKEILSFLKELKSDGRIDFSIERDIIKLEDIDLDEDEVEDLINKFYSNDIFPYLEMDDDIDDNYEDFDSYDDIDDY